MITQKQIDARDALIGYLIPFSDSAIIKGSDAEALFCKYKNAVIDADKEAEKIKNIINRDVKTCGSCTWYLADMNGCNISGDEVSAVNIACGSWEGDE